MAPQIKPIVRVRYHVPESRARAAALSQMLAVPLDEYGDAPCDVAVVVTPDRVELRDGSASRVGAVDVDFLVTQMPLTRRMPLVRAIGERNRSIIDVSAGYGVDARLLAGRGYFVTMIERCAAMAVLIDDGLRRLQAAIPAVSQAAMLRARLQLHVGDARDLLPALPAADVIYMDPMFPPKRKKSAAPNKAMRLLRTLAGDDTDAAELLAIARRHARDRVVVKRADDGAELLPDPDLVFRSKLVRYDVYWAEAKFAHE